MGRCCFRGELVIKVGVCFIIVERRVRFGKAVICCCFVVVIGCCWCYLLLVIRNWFLILPKYLFVVAGLTDSIDL